MTRVVCPQDHCVFWDGGACGADEISLDPEQLSCVSMEDIKDLILNGEDLEEFDEGTEEEEEWGEEELFGENDDEWEPY